MFESTSRSAWELERPLWNWRIATWFSRVQASPSTLPLFTWLWEASCRQIMVDPGTKFQSVSFFVLLRLSLLHLFFSTTPRCKLWTGWETQYNKLSLWTSLWQMGSHVFSLASNLSTWWGRRSREDIIPLVCMQLIGVIYIYTVYEFHRKVCGISCPSY